MNTTSLRKAELLGITDFKITITHTGDTALVFVVSIGKHR